MLFFVIRLVVKDGEVFVVCLCCVGEEGNCKEFIIYNRVLDIGEGKNRRKFMRFGC